jgi:hypothetical protein
VLAWQIGFDRTPQPDPAKASEVEVTFTAGAGGTTTIDLEHRGFTRAEGGEAYRDLLGADEGWPYLLGSYVSVVSESGDDVPRATGAESAARADDRLSGRGGRGSTPTREPGHLSTDELVEIVERASRRVRE